MYRLGTELSRNIFVKVSFSLANTDKKIFTAKVSAVVLAVLCLVEHPKANLT